MFKILVLLFSLAQLKCTDSQSPDLFPATYDVPSNTKYPYGDEFQFNNNILDNDTNPFPCIENKKVEKRLGKCPIEVVTDPSVLNPYTECPDFAVIPSPHTAVVGVVQKPNPEVQCSRCDLKLTTDNLAVLLECDECFDLPNPHRPQNFTQKNIEYKVFFVQISNYSSVNVTGEEYYNP